MKRGIVPREAPSGRRVRLTGYGSALLARASRVAPRCEEVTGTGLHALAERIGRGLVWLLLYRLILPSVRIDLSTGPAGAVIRQQLTMRRNGRLTFRHAQGVLFLPERYRDYLRGRHRQAVRTNIRHARDRGYVIETGYHDEWTLDPLDPRSSHITAAAPLECFHVLDRDGTRVAEAFITVDDRTALLHMATGTASYARWLLHAAIVERLCGHCDLLLTNTADVPLMSRGAQHYQRLLGYSAVRLRLTPTVSELSANPRLRVLGLCLVGTVAVLGAHLVLGPATISGPFALSWVTALVAIRRASYQAGPAAATATLVALILFGLRDFAAPMTALGFVLAGVALDVLLARIPRLTWSSLSVAPAGVAIALLAVLVSELGRVGDPDGLGGISSMVWIAAAVCGAFAAGIGWWVGGKLRPLIPVQVSAGAE